MEAVVLNGTEGGDPALDAVYDLLSGELENRGWEVKPFLLRDMEIAYCRGCFGCWVITPGVCVIDDAGRDIARAIIQSDLVVYLTPVTFGGYSAGLKKALDRSIGLLSPFFMKIGGEVHHRPRYERYPRLVGLGVLERPDEESEKMFATLVQRNAINMHSPAHAGGVVFGSYGAEETLDKIRRILSAADVEAQR